MKYAIALAAIAMTGCASMEPLTPEQAAVIMQMNQNQIANNNAMWQNMQANPVFQRQQQSSPAYVVPRPVYQEPAPRPRINCTTTNGGYSLYTTCY